MIYVVLRFNRKVAALDMQKLFPKKYYIEIFRVIVFMFSCIFASVAAGIWFIDWNILF